MIENSVRLFEQFYRMMRDIVGEFTDESWFASGHKLTRPPLLAYHILKSTKYYNADSGEFIRDDGTALAADYQATDADRITRSEILANISRHEASLQLWIRGTELASGNEKYPWTGVDMESVLLFIIRHNYFHLGEMSALLNETLAGDASDNFANNIY
jgi:hypothetical protein